MNELEISSLILFTSECQPFVLNLNRPVGDYLMIWQSIDMGRFYLHN